MFQNKITDAFNPTSQLLIIFLYSGRETTLLVKISGSQSGEYEYGRLMGYCTMQCGRWHFRAETSVNFYQTMRHNI